MNATSAPAEFVLSLDFELLWGVRDHSDRESYGRNILGAREAIPRTLDLFEQHRVAATWATVGFLFCRDRDELIDALPPEDLRPRYANPALSSYAYFDEIGQDEAADPYVFGASLVDRIQETPFQDIGTHTMSHYYCLEAGQTEAMFDADLAAATALAERRGITLRSIVFPRNQFTPKHLEICFRRGITVYRANPDLWAYAPVPGSGQTLARRAIRLIDQYTGFLGPHFAEREAGAPANSPASRFLRPCAGALKPLQPLHMRTIKAGMRRAAEAGTGYHLWWHPHNFGRDVDDNIAGLRDVLEHFARLRDSHGMVSRSMEGTEAS